MAEMVKSFRLGCEFGGSVEGWFGVYTAGGVQDRMSIPPSLASIRPLIYMGLRGVWAGRIYSKAPTSMGGRRGLVVGLCRG